MDKRGMDEGYVKVRVNNRVVEMELVPKSVHQSDGVVYNELNEMGQPCKEHSFDIDYFAGPSGGLFTNGNHYRFGSLTNIPCKLPECERCPKDLG